MTDENQLMVGRYEAGKADRPEELNELIGRAWDQAIGDPTRRAEIAAIFGLPPERLRQVPSPFSAKINKSGFFGAEVIIAVAAAFAIAYATELGTQAGQAAGKVTAEAAKMAWGIVQRYLRDTEPEGLGKELRSDDG